VILYYNLYSYCYANTQLVFRLVIVLEDWEIQDVYATLLVRLSSFIKLG